MSPGFNDDRYVEEEMQALSGSKGTIKELTLENTSQSQNLILKHSMKGGQSLEDLRGSVHKISKNGSKKSPSNRTNNLLKSVLSQNRDPDNYDFSEIIKYSPKQAASKASGVFSKTGYNSPKASKDKMMESTNSKKKKYGSIIVQPERSSPVNNRSVGNYPNP
jgi:hypothetical protein